MNTSTDKLPVLADIPRRTALLSDTAKTIISFAVLFLIYAAVDGLADVLLGGVL